MVSGRSSLLEKSEESGQVGGPPYSDRSRARTWQSVGREAYDTRGQKQGRSPALPYHYNFGCLTKKSSMGANAGTATLTWLPPGISL